MLLNEESNELIQFEKLFTMYQFESLDIFGLKDPINIERFSVGLQKCSNSKENGKKIKYVKGLKFQDFPS